MVRAKRVVITGVGVVSPLGIGKDEFWNSLEKSISGVAPITAFDRQNLPVPFGAEIRDFDPKQYVKPRKSLKVMCREIQIAFAAAALAMSDAQLEKGAIDPDRLGVVFGSELFYSDVADIQDACRSCLVQGKFSYDLWGERAMSDISPLWMLKYLPNMPACHIGIAHDARAHNNTITEGEVSSLLAFSEGVRVIERDRAEAMIVGGTGSRLNITGLLSRSESVLSHRAGDPEAASRPFDASRDGMVNGEGSAAFVIESLDHAKARGANILGEVLACNSSFEACLSGNSTGKGIRHSIQQTLNKAEMRPAEIGHVNANGLSTIQEDAQEAQAINDILENVPVTAPKSFFGNLGAGTGAVEMAASVLAFSQGMIPVTLNYETPDPACPLNIVHQEPLPLKNPTALVLNQTRTGQVAAVLLSGG